MSLAGERPAWFDQAACQGLAHTIGGPARDRIFFPQRGESLAPARRYCDNCPVAQECLDHSLDNGLVGGVWAGQSAKERVKIRRRRRLEMAS